jgi:hypothetical protein
MAKPIAQTFYINEPVGGAEGVVLTAIDIYFQSVSPSYGVEVQIRSTENGNPTPYILPEASKILQASEVVESADATVPTKFTFDTPIMLQSQKSYAFVIIPLGGNPDYKVWTAELGGTDVSLNTPITTNSDTGTLFLSSNDIQFTSVQTEDIKFTLYTADFTVSGGQGTAVYTMGDTEQILFQAPSGSFTNREQVYISNCAFNLARLTMTSNTGAYTTGEVIYQSNGSVNVATGVLYYANTTTVLITNAVGAFVVSSSNTTFNLKGATSAANAVISVANQSVITYSNSTVTVPFTGNGTSNIFYTNQSVYLGTNSRSTMQARVVNSVANSTTLYLSSNINFVDTSSLLGQIRGDLLGMYARWNGPSSTTGGENYQPVFLKESKADNVANFTNSYGQYLIGGKSTASAVAYLTINFDYNAIVPQFADSQSLSTNIDYAYTGIQNTGSSSESTSWPVYNNTEYEFNDMQRVLKSRSNEIVNNAGAHTSLLTATLTTANNKISPAIDTMRSEATFIRNLISANWMTYGYVVQVSNATGQFVSYRRDGGDYVTQVNNLGTATGQLTYGNNSTMYISNTTGQFVNGYSIYVTSNSSCNAYVNVAKDYSEKYNTGIPYRRSRYISKSVILADKQDAEDLQVYLTAYRPANTNFKIYAKILNALDQDSFNVKYWNRLVETSSPALISSGTNKDDFVELVYAFPTSQILLSNAAQCNTTSANVTVSSTSGVSNGSYVYLYNTAANTFIVRQVNTVANNTTLVLNTLPSITSNSTAYCDLGLIPGIEDNTGAFLFSNNSNIVRYVSNADVVYDTFKNFAIKIIPTADYSAVIPRAADVRCLALQV